MPQGKKRRRTREEAFFSVVLDDKGHILGPATEGSIGTSGAPTLGGCSCAPAPVPAGHTGTQEGNAG